jgi:nickel transport protein
MKRLTVLPAALLAGVLHAHSLSHTVQTGSAVIVDLRYGDGSPFSYESAEVFRPSESVPFLSGRTDANGRLAFVPDRSGDWRVRAFSEDGHGGDFTVPASGDGTVPARPAPLGAIERVAVGVALLFGLFGIWSLFLRRRP